jgi:transposase
MKGKPEANRFTPDVRARAVRMVQDHLGDHPSEWAAICSIASKIGCTVETLRNRIRQGQRDKGVREGPKTEEQARKCGSAAPSTGRSRRPA